MTIDEERQLRATLRTVEKIIVAYVSVGKIKDAQAAERHASLIREKLEGEAP